MVKTTKPDGEPPQQQIQHAVILARTTNEPSWLEDRPHATHVPLRTEAESRFPPGS